MDLLAAVRDMNLRAALDAIKADMQRERLLADLYADHVDAVALEVDVTNFHDSTLKEAMQGENPLREAVNRLLDPIKAGGAQWSGDDTWTADRKAVAKALAALLPDVATRLVLTGKAAVFPWRSLDDGRVRLTAVQGYLHPIRRDDAPGELERLLIFEGAMSRAGERRYTVWDCEPGRITRYEGVDDVARYREAAKRTAFDLPYSADRLPVAFVEIERVAGVGALAPAAVALSPFKRFVHRLMQENVSYRSGAYKQRVITGGTGAPSRGFGPFRTLELEEGADYKEVGADTPLLNQMTATRAQAAEEVCKAAGAPLSEGGAGESGEARAMLDQRREQTAVGIAERAAELLNDAADLLARMGEMPKAPAYTVKPYFTARVAATRAEIRELHKDGLISKYEALIRLEETGMTFSPEELEAAKKLRDHPPQPPAPAPAPTPADPPKGQ